MTGHFLTKVVVKNLHQFAVSIKPLHEVCSLHTIGRAIFTVEEASQFQVWAGFIFSNCHSDHFEQKTHCTHPFSSPPQAFCRVLESTCVMTKWPIADHMGSAPGTSLARVYQGLPMICTRMVYKLCSVLPGSMKGFVFGNLCQLWLALHSGTVQQEVAWIWFLGGFWQPLWWTRIS